MLDSIARVEKVPKRSVGIELEIRIGKWHNSLPPLGEVVRDSAGWGGNWCGCGKKGVRTQNRRLNDGSQVRRKSESRSSREK